jgi:hypothetical protein
VQGLGGGGGVGGGQQLAAGVRQSGCGAAARAPAESGLPQSFQSGGKGPATIHTFIQVVFESMCECP